MISSIGSVDDEESPFSANLLADFGPRFAAGRKAALLSKSSPMRHIDVRVLLRKSHLLVLENEAYSICYLNVVSGYDDERNEK